MSRVHICSSACETDHELESILSSCDCDTCAECHEKFGHHWSMWTELIECAKCLEDWQDKVIASLSRNECQDHEDDGCRLCELLRQVELSGGLE